MIPRFLLMGDSVSAQCQEGTNDWFYIGNVNANRPLRPIPAGSGRNKGIGGNTTSQMLTRFRTDVTLYGTDWLSIFGGINDIGAFSNPNTALVLSNLQSMYEQFLSTCTLLSIANRTCGLLIATVYPTDFMTTANQKAARATVNTWLATYAASRNGVYLVDWASTMESAPNVLNPAYSDDGVHPNAAGATAMAGVLTPVLANVGS